MNSFSSLKGFSDGQPVEFLPVSLADFWLVPDLPVENLQVALLTDHGAFLGPVGVFRVRFTQGFYLRKVRLVNVSLKWMGTVPCTSTGIFKGDTVDVKINRISGD